MSRFEIIQEPDEDGQPSYWLYYVDRNDEWHTVSGPVQTYAEAEADLAEVEPGTCIYCDAVNCERVDPESNAPAIDDDETWTRYALEHRDFCEWILTRAHQLTYDLTPEEEAKLRERIEKLTHLAEEESEAQRILRRFGYLLIGQNRMKKTTCAVCATKTSALTHCGYDTIPADLKLEPDLAEGYHHRHLINRVVDALEDEWREQRRRIPRGMRPKP